MLQNAMQVGLWAVQASNNNETSCFHMILLRFWGAFASIFVVVLSVFCMLTKTITVSYCFIIKDCNFSPIWLQVAFGGRFCTVFASIFLVLLSGF